jgi:UDP-N-acetylglucosamine:LPS N-acetylglucosamine transferase
MGAGHDGAARELARRLSDEGHVAEVRDFMKSAPLKIGDLVRVGYEFQIRHAAWTYELTYRLWYLLPLLVPPIGRFIAWLTHRRLLRWVRDFEADVVVSTYPLASVALGRLRETGKLPVPAVNYITDFAVHPLWVHHGLDLNLAVHPRPASQAARLTGRPAVAVGPMVAPRFLRKTPRAPARRALGLEAGDRAVLIVAGSLGVGGVAKTFRSIAGSGRFIPIAVCGRDEKLRRRLERIGGGRVLGWTDDMPGLMAASDALIENAGGLTAMEAFAAGLPVVSYRPIAGHGKQNTAEMQEARISRLAPDDERLMQILDAVTTASATRAGMVKAGRAMFADDPTGYVAALAAGHRPAEVAAGAPATAAAFAGAGADIVPIAAARSSFRRWGGRAAATAIAVPLLWAGLTSGVDVAAAYGAGVAHPRGHTGNMTYLGVRLDASELTDPAIQEQLAALHATAVVDGVTAARSPAAIQRLASLEVDVESGGQGRILGRRRSDTPWRRAHGDIRASRLLERLAGEPVTVFVPGRRINVFDLVACRSAHTRTVVPNHVFRVGDVDSVHMTARHTYLVDGERATASELAALLTKVANQLSRARLDGAPLVELR